MKRIKIIKQQKKSLGLLPVYELPYLCHHMINRKKKIKILYFQMHAGKQKRRVNCFGKSSRKKNTHLKGGISLPLDLVIFRNIER
jgi:hypothetical protein